MKAANVILAGVGGQGAILASKILSEALASAGYDIKMSEVHGMSQRGGAVLTELRYGEKIRSPLVAASEADVLVAFEKSEALRHMGRLRLGGTLIVNELEIRPLPVLQGLEDYPKALSERYASVVEHCLLVPASSIAEGLGFPQGQNIVLLGTLAGALDMDDIDWKDIIRRFVRERFLGPNLRAFEAGLSFFLSSSTSGRAL